MVSERQITRLITSRTAIDRPLARPGRPPKRVHSNNPLDNDVLEKLKRRKLDIPGEYPYDQRFYERKPLMNGFPPVGYPAMPQFSNFFSMHHLMQPMAMASHIGLRPDAGVPKLERSTTDSGIISPRPRDERLPMLGMYPGGPGMDPRLPHRPPEGDTSKPLNLQVNGHHKESEASRSDDGYDDDKLSEDERPVDEDLDDSYDSDDYHSGDAADKPRPGSNPNPFSAVGGESASTELDPFVVKFNAVVRALVDATKAVERRVIEEKNQLSLELLREKDKSMKLEREVQEERKKREFFQRRVRRLKKALRDEAGSPDDSTKQMDKSDRPRPECTPEHLRGTQELNAHDVDSESQSIPSSHTIDLDRKTDSSPASRPMTTRELFDSLNKSHHTPPTSNSMKFPYHQMIAPSDV
ncbi:dachshund 2 [Biomphalaria pfeifferi]|uniref:Dachshund 2 n=1 Tax=Biomphalaria pfeifferi TaxID=112525 RepID=A0AAD8BWI7_BIOPF|nr:dachshund 2 [Biomphalaria pfeifferi]